MRLTLVICSLYSGGAERVMSIMANYWAEKGWEVTLITLDGRPSFYTLDYRIKHIPLGVVKKSHNYLTAVWNNLTRIWKLRSTIIAHKPETAISFLDTTNVLTILATRGLKIPVLVTEHIYPPMYPTGKSWELLRQWTYLRANRVVAVTTRALSYFSHQIQSRGCVIPNPALSIELSPNSSDNLLVKPSLIAMGRMVPQKGFDLLIQAFSQIKNRHPEWSLTILGEGPLYSELESLSKQLGLADCVYLPGVVKNPYEFLKQADIYVMSSRFEGFPNVLCEAMACGLPVISTDCPSGPREIVRDGIDGILVPNEDVSQLIAAMDLLMTDEDKRKGLAARAPEITERFSLEKIMRMWENVIDEVITEMPRK